ncbi:rod shape-determining protein [Pseudonocardia sp. DR1-2]|uniref:rod shape-determining protein n=1 Tax=Pseudonocardia sp. DR1-2 TaxID=2951168 RepID=UPI002043C7AD|nr:rod shape-determining protein [Pseudonocardia sp. DR1-2]MCM3847701.1 rod shape-determining protein [Pseudonocardia sp. DR1-2]
MRSPAAPEAAGGWWEVLMSGVGLDPGTARTVVHDGDGGFVFDEPSVLLTTGHGRRTLPVLIGLEAEALTGRLPTGREVQRPFRHGVVADLDAARTYLRAVVRRAVPRPWARTRATAVIGTPVGATRLEQRALLEVADEVGIGQVYALVAPVAAGLGCGIDPLDRRAHLVVDVGAGTAEIAAFCFGDVLAHRSHRSAGDVMTGALLGHLRGHHRLSVTAATAEALKCAATGEDGAQDGGRDLSVQGRDTASGRPRTLTLPAGEVLEVLAPVTASVVGGLVGCLDDLPVQVLDDVLTDGLLLVGGGSLSAGIARSLETAFGVPVKHAENPTTCVAEGAARATLRPEVLAAYAQH